MEPSRVAWGLIVGLPTTILAVTAVVSPSFALPILIVLIALWVGAIVVWQALKIRS